MFRISKKKLLEAKLFNWAWLRHMDNHDNKNTQYEVCRSPVCRIAWWLENWLWYGGEAVP